MLSEFPTESDWRELGKTYPYKKLEVSQDLFPYAAHPRGTVENFAANQDSFVWTVHLANPGGLSGDLRGVEVAHK